MARKKKEQAGTAPATTEASETQTGAPVATAAPTPPAAESPATETTPAAVEPKAPPKPAKAKEPKTEPTPVIRTPARSNRQPSPGQALPTFGVKGDKHFGQVLKGGIGRDAGGITVAIRLDGAEADESVTLPVFEALSDADREALRVTGVNQWAEWPEKAKR